MKKENKKNIITYGLFGLIIGIILGILVTTSFNPTGDAIKLTSQNSNYLNPAQITSVTSNYTDCAQGEKAYFTFDWKTSEVSARHRGYLLGFDDKEIALKLLSNTNVGYPGAYLDPNMSSGVQGYAILDGTDYKCGDNYYLYIDSIIDNQIVTSKEHRFSWNN